MVFIASFSSRLESIKKLAPIYAKLDKLPAHIRRSGPYFRIDKATGSFRGLVFYSTEEGRAEDLHEFLIERFKAFSGVPNFVYVIEQWYGLEVAVRMVQGDQPAS